MTKPERETMIVQVWRCDDMDPCPMRRWTAKAVNCQHPETDGWEIGGDGTPDWCPLRTRPVLVVLAEEKAPPSASRTGRP